MESRNFVYKDAKKDLDGWIKCDDHMPHLFDLCWLRMEDGYVKKGWHSGSQWDGLKIKETDKFVSWKKSLE